MDKRCYLKTYDKYYTTNIILVKYTIVRYIVQIKRSNIETVSRKVSLLRHVRGPWSSIKSEGYEQPLSLFSFSGSAVNPE